QQITAQQRVLEQQQRELDSLRGRASGATAAAQPAGGQPAGGGAPAAGAALATPRRANLASARGSTDTAQVPGPGSPPGGITRPDVRPEIADPSIATQGGVLTPRNAIVLEPSFEYNYQSSNQAVVSGFTIIPGITFGNININQANHYIYTPA